MAVFKRKSKVINSGNTPQLTEIHSVEELYQLAREANIEIHPLDIIPLVKLIGIRVKVETMNDNVSGYLKRVSGRWIMGVNALHHIKRQRFTIAHELAHYCLHSGSNDVFEDTILFRKGDQNSMEYQANDFAAKLLMPEKDFREFISDSSNIDEIADNFNVSSMAVRVRAKVLGMNGHGL